MTTNIRAWGVICLFCIATLVHAGPSADEFPKLARSGNHWDRVEAVKAAKELPPGEQAEALLLLAGDAFERVRFEVADALAKIEDGVVRANLREVSLHKLKTPLARATVARSFGLAEDKEAIPEMVKALDDRKEELSVAIYDALIEIEEPSPEATEVALRDLDKGKKPMVRAAAAAALSVLTTAEDADALAALVEATTERDYTVRLRAIETLVRWKCDEAVTAVSNGLSDDTWQVQAACCEWAVTVWDKRVVPSLIELFAESKARLRYDAYLSLRQLTGKELPFDPEPWEEWWKNGGEYFNLTGEPVDPLEVDAIGGVSSTQTFHEIPIVSTRVYFILDLSGSMRNAAGKDENGKKVDKLDVLKKEMIETIKSFGPKTFFNIVLLGSEEDASYDLKKKVWNRMMVPASPGNRNAAIKFIEKQEPKGWTNIFDAVDVPFMDPSVDTIYLLSDGGASRGTYVARLDIFRELMIRNRYRRVMIHAIETGATKDSDRNLMKKLARFTRGQFKSLDAKGEKTN